MENGNLLQDRVAHQHEEPALLYEAEIMDGAVEEAGGALAVSSADPYREDQVHLDLYVGDTRPSAGQREVPHVHFDQTEAYVQISGEAELWMKWRWDDNGWKQRTLHAGDFILVQPQACHWFRWRSKDGRALVFKRQIPGVGKPPAGKQTCTNGCPHYKRGCVLPDGFNPEPSLT